VLTLMNLPIRKAKGAINHENDYQFCSRPI